MDERAKAGFDYPSWRFLVWLQGDMTYGQIDQAVSEGRLTPGILPASKEEASRESAHRITPGADNAAAAAKGE